MEVKGRESLFLLMIPPRPPHPPSPPSAASEAGRCRRHVSGYITARVRRPWFLWGKRGGGGGGGEEGGGGNFRPAGGGRALRGMGDGWKLANRLQKEQSTIQIKGTGLAARGEITAEEDIHEMRSGIKG